MGCSVLLMLAFLLDALIGDPPWLPHPVRLLGRAITLGERWLRRGPVTPAQEVVLGFALVLSVTLSAYLLTALLLHTLTAVSWWLGQGAAAVLGSLCLARRSLKEHAQAVLHSLCAGDLPTARLMLARMVSRETADLPETAIVRGTLESVAENSSDGVIAPLFYLALGGVPLAMAYKAINTLDSMLGYRTERYEYFGKVAARCDDVANFIPARLTAIALIGAAWGLECLGYAYSGTTAWSITWRDGHKHLSPNAGYPEAALAGALGVQLGGPSRYCGVWVAKPTLGDAYRALTPDLIAKSLAMLDTASVLALAACVGVRWWW
jgi:adenosylcobinamide-phosphate synthase